MIEVRDLVKKYGDHVAVDHLSFTAEKGKIYGFLGPNGAGKSTLIKALAGLIHPDAGNILWNGNPLHDMPREIAYLPQRSDVDWSFPITVRALVEMGRYPALGLWKKFSGHDREIVEKSLHVLGLEHLAERQISELSGGQQQRAFLARALAQEAHVLLLDEPFNGLSYCCRRNTYAHHRKRPDKRHYLDRPQFQGSAQNSKPHPASGSMLPKENQGKEKINLLRSLSSRLILVSFSAY
mgnify:CR=1 FL=1